MTMKTIVLETEERGQAHELSLVCTAYKSSLVFHAELQGKKNVSRITRFSSGFILSLGTIFIPSAMGAGAGVEGVGSHKC